MKQKRYQTISAVRCSVPHLFQKASGRAERSARAAEVCRCLPLTTLMSHPVPLDTADDATDSEHMVLASRDLYARLRSLVDERCQHMASISILLLHMFQLEATPLGPQTTMLYTRRRYHAAAGVLDQVLANVRRVIRVDDEMVIYAQAGAAIVFPEVNPQGGYHILERVYNNISLLQAETLLPPLKRETVIQLGLGSLSRSASSIERLLSSTGQLAHCLTLRPALSTQLRAVKPLPASDEDGADVYNAMSTKRAVSSGEQTQIPFMDLPLCLPVHLTHLLPYELACELRCAPVGRDQGCLTVALADPANSVSIQRLQACTGMLIFPVACNEQALTALLSNNKW